MLFVGFLLLLSGIIFTGIGFHMRAGARTNPNDRAEINPTLRPAFPPQIPLAVDWLTGDLRPRGSYIILAGAVCLSLSIFLALFLLDRDCIRR